MLERRPVRLVTVARIRSSGTRALYPRVGFIVTNLKRRPSGSLALPKEVEQWSLTTLREKLVKIGPLGRPAWPLRRLPAGRGRRAAGPLCRDPASDRPAARTACAGDMMGGKQMMDAVEGRAMRRSPAEPAATGCRRPWKRLRSVPTLKIASLLLSC